MRIILLIAMLLASGCTSEDPNKLTNKDIEMARCLCKINFNEELRIVKREPGRLVFDCKPGNPEGSQHGFIHDDNSYSEGCSKR